MAVVRKKQDDKYLKALRELVTTGGGNRQCFDCGQKGPTYVNMTIGSFVCTRCSGVLRGLTPPHRVKSISMATFTQEEIDFLKAHGNDLSAKTWLGLWDPKRAVHQDQRELMIDKYERKRYYLEPASPLKSLTNAASLKTNASAVTQQTNNNNISHSNSISSTASLTNGFNHNHNHNHNHKHNSIDNSFQSIQLTPPSSQRTTVNGLSKSSSSAISRPTQHQTNGFSHHHQDAFMINNGLNGLHGLNASVGSASTGALSDTSSCTSNGFGNDADFVADFGSANIFDATPASSVGSPAVSSASSVASTNGYAKIQPIKAAHQFMNGHANTSKPQLNGAPASSANGNVENFADFDHAPIFSANESYQFVRKRNIKKAPTTAQQKQQQAPQQSTQNGTENFFASLKQTLIDDVDEVGNNSNNYNNNRKSNNTTSSKRAQSNFNESFFSAETNHFNDPFDDFPIAVGYNSQKPKTSDGGRDSQKSQQPPYQALNQQPVESTPPPTTTKFTPLAMAAHATAMAVLGSNSHFNSHDDFAYSQWDVWQEKTALDDASVESIESPRCFADSFWSPSARNANNKRYATIAPSTDAAQSRSSHTYSASADELNANNLTLNALSFGVPPASASPVVRFSPIPEHEPEAEAELAPPAPAPIAPFITPTGRLNKAPTATFNSGFNSNNNNNSNKLHSTPAEDRYAALKDLDEQIRESKAVAAVTASMVASTVVDAYGNGNSNNNNGATANAGNANPFKSQQQPNPFQATPNTLNFSGQMTAIPNGFATQATAQAAQQQHQQNGGGGAFFNYNNGFSGVPAPTATALFPPMQAGGPNGCGFGFGTMQQQMATAGGMGNAFNNPFAQSTGALNANNPFL